MVLLGQIILTFFATEAGAVAPVSSETLKVNMAQAFFLKTDCGSDSADEKDEKENQFYHWSSKVLLRLSWRKAAGLKSVNGVNQYMSCYPLGEEGKKNYARFDKFLRLASHTFETKTKREKLDVHPTLLRCLIRRESGFLTEAKSGTGAVGFGQHTNINILDINQRIHRSGSWEQILWRKFFTHVRNSEEGRLILAECPGESFEGYPNFFSKADAACPLQSIAATSLYILLIQKELSVASNSSHVALEEELDYQLAIAGAYNLGNGNSKKAVDDLFVSAWLKSILLKSQSDKNPGKADELKNHIDAIKNCMQAENWKPMMESDKPVCENFEELQAR